MPDHDPQLVEQLARTFHHSVTPGRWDHLGAGDREAVRRGIRSVLDALPGPARPVGYAVLDEDDFIIADTRNTSPRGLAWARSACRTGHGVVALIRVAGPADRGCR